MLHDQLKQYRLRHGYSQEQLAEQLDVSRQAVTKWENGQSKPSSKHLHALADLYGISTEVLLNNEHTPQTALATTPTVNPILRANLTTIAIIAQTTLLSVAMQHLHTTDNRLTLVFNLVVIWLPLLAASIWMATNHRFENNLTKRKRNTHIELLYCLIQLVIALLGAYTNHLFIATICLCTTCLIYIIKINPKYMNRIFVKSKHQ